MGGMRIRVSEFFSQRIQIYNNFFFLGGEGGAEGADKGGGRVGRG